MIMYQPNDPITPLACMYTLPDDLCWLIFTSPLLRVLEINIYIGIRGSCASGRQLY